MLCPKYLKDVMYIVQPTDGVSTRLQLFSSHVCGDALRMLVLDFKFANPKLYDEIPLEIRKVESIHSFKKNLVSYSLSVMIERI